MPRIAHFIWLFGLPLLAWSQIPRYSPEKEAKVYLQDGRVIHGVLSTLQDADTVGLYLPGGSYVRLPQHRIDSIRYDQNRYQFLTRLSRDQSPVQYRKAGRYQRISFDLMAYQQPPELWQNLGLNVHLAYQIGKPLGPKLNAEGGLGVQGNTLGTFFSVFGALTGTLLQRQNAPFYSFRAGYSLAIAPAWIASNLRGGLYIHPSIGLHRHTRGKISWQFLFGYQLQQYRADALCWTCPDFTQLPISGWLSGFSYGVAVEFLSKK